MEFFKKNFLLILILILGFYLRFNIELFIQGYCFDEIAMVSIAKQAFPFEILKQAALLDYHAPLYYFIAHFFTHLSKEWMFLRFFNLILALINITVFYLIGKNLYNKTAGLLCALFFAANHLAITTVSFVKFYCLCFLLVSLSVLFLVKSLKKEKHLYALGIINALYVYSATLGFIFVFFEYSVLFWRYRLSDKNTKKKLVISLSIALLGFLAYLPVLLQQTNAAFTNVISPHGAYAGAYLTEVCGIFNDFISPFLNYCCNYNTMHANEILYIFLAELLKIHKFDAVLFLILLVFSCIPVILSLYLNYVSIKNNKYCKYIAAAGFSFLISLIILMRCQVLGFVTIYFYPFGLIYLILLASGIYFIKNKTLRVFILIYLAGIQLLVTNVFPIQAREADKDKIYYCFEEYFKQNKIDDDTIFVMTVGGRFLEKYYNNRNIAAFDYEEMGGCHGRKFIKLIYGDDVYKKANKFNVQKLVKPIIQNNIKNPDFENYVIKNVIEKARKNQKIILAFNTDGSPFIDSDRNIDNILNSKKYRAVLLDPVMLFETDIEYVHTNTSDMFDAISSYSNKYLLEILDRHLKRISVEQYIMTKDFHYKKHFSTNHIAPNSVWYAQHANKGWVFITYVKQ